MNLFGLNKCRLIAIDELAHLLPSNLLPLWMTFLYLNLGCVLTVLPTGDTLNQTCSWQYTSIVVLFSLSSRDWDTLELGPGAEMLHC